MLIELLFLFSILRGATSLWTLHNSSSVETTMKTILESCYENKISSNPILILGDSDEFYIDSSIIRLNYSFNFAENYAHKNDQILHFKASKIIAISDSSENLDRGLIFLQESQWWNDLAPLFIIARNEGECMNFEDIFTLTESINIVTTVYICKSKENIVLFTSNPIANYAPYPWRRLRIISPMNVFRQVFDIKFSCDNLHYDRTNILHGYEIRLISWAPPEYGYIPDENYCEALPHVHEIGFRAIRSSIRRINATCRLKLVNDSTSSITLLYNGFADVYKDTMLPPTWRDATVQYFAPTLERELIAVIGSSPEITTLQKLMHLWSPAVLYVSLLVLLILLSILTLKNVRFSSAILDMVRFLTYSSIETTIKTHSFRIYFTTMLIFIVISNGVFEGKIAAFLTTLEKLQKFETFEELMEAKYRFYTFSGYNGTIFNSYPNLETTDVELEKCIDLVVNGSSNVCVIDRQLYEEQWALLPVETVEMPSSKYPEYYIARSNWPLFRRVNSKLVQMSEAGLIEFWGKQHTSTPLKKREAKKIELSLPRYRSIKLYKLDFAFQMLGIGLGFATIAFFCELMTVRLFNH